MILQIIKFVVVGAIATILDFGVLVVLKELLGIDVLIASALSFCVSVAANYILSMAFVFESKNQNKVKEFIINDIKSQVLFLIVKTRPLINNIIPFYLTI